MNWNIIQFDNWYVNSVLREDHNGVVVDFSGGISYFYSDPRPELNLVGVEHDFQFLPNTRQLKSGRLVFRAADGSKIEISVRALTLLYLRPGGYFPYKGFSHGMWMGPSWIDVEKLDITDSKVISEVSLLDDNMCECRCGDEIGYGIVELALFGEYPRYGG